MANSKRYSRICHRWIDILITPTDGVVIKIERKKTRATDAERLTIWLQSSDGDIFKLSQIFPS